MSDTNTVPEDRRCEGCGGLTYPGDDLCGGCYSARAAYAGVFIHLD